MLKDYLLKHLNHSLNACHKGVYLFFCIVECEGSTDCSRNIETFHKWLGAMMTCADCYSELVEKCSQIHWVYIANEETYGTF